MSDKSYVSIEKKQCPICGTLHDVGILLDTRLRDSMEQSTVTGYDLCPEHKELHESGYIAFIGVANNYHPQDNKGHVSDAPRTGEYIHMRRELAKQMIPNMPDDHLAQPLVFIPQESIDQIKEIMTPTETDSIQ